MLAKQESELEKFATLFVDELHATEGRLIARFEAADSRFDAIDKRFDAVEKRLDTLEEDVAYIRREIHTISGRLDWLYDQIGNIPGFAKEIDDLRARVAVIEHTLTARA